MTCFALIGYRGCGKTTVGMRLAESLGWEFVDLDSVIETTIGMPISQFFATHGEPAFRHQETDALKSYHKKAANFVLSTGGGCVLSAENRAILREIADFRCYLAVPAPELQRRLRLDAGQRPSLTGTSVVDEVPTILAQREPLYREVATHVVDAAVAVEQVIASLKAIVEN